MNKEQLAELLNGREYRNEITREEAKLAKGNGLLVCFGVSDDLLELEGIISDEVGARNGTTAVIVKNKSGAIDILSEYSLREIQQVLSEHNLPFNLNKVEIEAKWAPKDPECSWLITTELPHATFDIFEDGDLYCRGMVVDQKDIEDKLK